MPGPSPVRSQPAVAGLQRPAPRVATAEDLPQLSQALADAFIDDPVYTWMLPGTLRHRSRLRTMFTAEMKQYVLPNGGSVWTTSGGDGAVFELPPGAWAMPTVVTGTQALVWLRVFGTRMPLALRVQRVTEARHLREPHFYVRIVGVRGASQGRGLGSELMQPTLHRADAAGLPTYIEASSRRSAALYERLGFRHLEVLELPEGGPPLWPMRRPAAG